MDGQYLKELIDYWIDGYDWREAEAELNQYEQYQVEVDGVPIHFMRRAGVGPDPKPMLLFQGWPWTVAMATKVIDKLADPGAHGGDPAEAFDVIVPSTPGFGWSTPLPDNPDMNFWKAADLFHKLMTEVLGSEKYAATGSDLGSMITAQLGHKYYESLYAIHVGSPIPLNMFNGDRAWDLTGGKTIPEGTPEDIRAGILSFQKRFVAHVAVHMLDSSTLGHALSDSPAGLLAWILEGRTGATTTATSRTSSARTTFSPTRRSTGPPTRSAHRCGCTPTPTATRGPRPTTSPRPFRHPPASPWSGTRTRLA
ncbi:hypothetical protein SSP24_04100 [Streptomyces spinoverrucosus]|uniref:Epoxide hydrolase N-terminal domain-containing protein n=1 Tax=Streptomyces spinoverrucosus TaxID=284043 RepID=A0A4Y3V8K2_9ACTN|nr:hypothetical protein SSP24_04100 [Streptomyces spinoverrucosus]GHB40697.1 hypothetical protein GCM10010397_08500 [Streptomyces spinoverrucosus]